MRRWVAAVVAVLFLSTATLHPIAHVGDSDGTCSVCRVQQNGVFVAPAPAVVVVAIPETEVAEALPPAVSAAALLRAAARAPPSVPA